MKSTWLFVFLSIISPCTSNKWCDENPDYFCVIPNDCELIYRIMDSDYTCNGTDVCCRRAGKRCWSVNSMLTLPPFRDSDDVENTPENLDSEITKAKDSLTNFELDEAKSASGSQQNINNSLNNNFETKSMSFGTRSSESRKTRDSFENYTRNVATESDGTTDEGQTNHRTLYSTGTSDLYGNITSDQTENSSNPTENNTTPSENTSDPTEKTTDSTEKTTGPTENIPDTTENITTLTESEITIHSEMVKDERTTYPSSRKTRIRMNKRSRIKQKRRNLRKSQKVIRRRAKTTKNNFLVSETLISSETSTSTELTTVPPPVTTKQTTAEFTTISREENDDDVYDFNLENMNFEKFSDGELLDITRTDKTEDHHGIEDYFNLNMKRHSTSEFIEDSTNSELTNVASSRMHHAAEELTYFERLTNAKPKNEFLVSETSTQSVDDTMSSTQSSNTKISETINNEDEILRRQRYTFNTKIYWEKLPTQKANNYVSEPVTPSIENESTDVDDVSDFMRVHAPKQVRSFWELQPNQLEGLLSFRKRDSFVVPQPMLKRRNTDYSEVSNSNSVSAVSKEATAEINDEWFGRWRLPNHQISEEHLHPKVSDVNRSSSSPLELFTRIRKRKEISRINHNTTSETEESTYLELSSTRNNDLLWTDDTMLDDDPTLFDRSETGELDFRAVNETDNNNNNTDSQLYRHWVIAHIKMTKRKRCSVAAFHTVKHVHIRVSMPCTFPLPVVDREFHRKSTVVYMRNDSQSPFDCLTCQVERRHPKPGCSFKAKVAAPVEDIIHQTELPSEFAIFERPNDTDGSWSMFICKQRAPNSNKSMNYTMRTTTMSSENVISQGSFPALYTPSVFNLITIERKQLAIRKKGSKHAKRDAELLIDNSIDNQLDNALDSSIGSNQSESKLNEIVKTTTAEVIDTYAPTTSSNHKQNGSTRHANNSVVKRATLSLILGRMIPKKLKNPQKPKSNFKKFLVEDNSSNDDPTVVITSGTDTNYAQQTSTLASSWMESTGADDKNIKKFNTYRVWITQLTRRWIHDPISLSTVDTLPTKNDTENQI